MLTSVNTTLRIRMGGGVGTISYFNRLKRQAEPPKTHRRRLQNYGGGGHESKKPQQHTTKEVKRWQRLGFTARYYRDGQQRT